VGKEINQALREQNIIGVSHPQTQLNAISLQHVAVNVSKKFLTQASETPPGK
jgi:hypothetical protein